VIAPWAVLQPGMKAFLKRLSGAPVDQPPDINQGVKVVLERQEQIKVSANGQLADIDFAVISDVGVGDYEYRQRYDPNTPYPGDTYSGPGAPLGSIIVETNENRQVTFQVTVTGALTATFNAREICRTIRDRLTLPSALDELRTLGLALADYGPVQGPIPQLDPNMRAVPQYAFEFVCNYMTYVIDVPQTTIETADIATTVDT